MLVLSSTFPSSTDPSYGVFVKERLRAVACETADDIRVVAPAPYFPPTPFSTRWSHWSKMPRRESYEGLDVLRPRYLMLPKIGGYVQASLMFRAARKSVRQLMHEGFEFDLIDSHFVYPNGVVGAMLAEEFGKPLVMTGRGEDILRFPGLPVIGNKIRWAVRRATQCVALSHEIADAFERAGAPRHRITVIPNGVDCEKFRPLPTAEARRHVGLPAGRRVVVSVGNCQERKGFHLLVDALGEIRKACPDVLLVIVGGPAPYGNDHTPVIRERIRALGLEDHVRLVGSRPHEELHQWYSAADLFALLSSREGSPNVLMEALACGTPAVATPVGGIPEVLADPRLGIVIPERSAAAAAEGIAEAFNRTWDRAAIRQTLESRSWRTTALAVVEVFDRALSDAANRSQSRLQAQPIPG